MNMASDANTKSAAALAVDTSTRIVVTKLNSDIMVSDKGFAELSSYYELDCDRIPSVVDDEIIATSLELTDGQRSSIVFDYSKDSLEELEDFLGENRDRRRNSFLTVGVIWDTGRLIGGSGEYFGCHEDSLEDRDLILDANHRDAILSESVEINNFLRDDDSITNDTTHLLHPNLSKNIQSAITVQSLHEMIGGFHEPSDSDSDSDLQSSAPDTARTSSPSCFHEELMAHRRCSNAASHDNCSSVEGVGNPEKRKNISNRRSSIVLLSNKKSFGDENVSEYSHEVLINCGLHQRIEDKSEDIIGEINEFYRDQLTQM